MSALASGKRGTTSSKPRVLLLADIPAWAYDFTARSLAHHLADRFRISIAYSSFAPRVDPHDFDLLYVFHWAEKAPERYGFAPSRVIREVASYRWATSEWHGRLSPSEFVARHLSDCCLVTTPARFLQQLLTPHHPQTFLAPKGYEPGLFRQRGTRRGPLRIGWVGNPDDASKGLHDILIPATAGRHDFRFSPGTWNRTRGAWTRGRVARFYNTIDVLAIASVAEGQPLCLIEAMAAGCFPVAPPIGIVPELVRSGVNGLIVERSVEAYQAAFSSCDQDLETVRMAGDYNAVLMRETRTWAACATRFAELFEHALSLDGGAAGTRPPAVFPPEPISERLPDALPADLQKTSGSAREAWGVVSEAREHIRWRLSDARIRGIAFLRESPQRLRAWVRRILPAALRRMFRGQGSP